MPRQERSSFFCSHCGNESPRWMGFCPACGSSEPLVEAPRTRPSGRTWLRGPATEPQELSQVSLEDAPRMPLSSSELNRVLGGGVVPGSVILLAGDPGIGKSTLLLQTAAALLSPSIGRSDRQEEGKVLYVSGEESSPQIRMRAQRLGISGEGLFLLGETNVDDVLSHLERMPVGALVVDSIQTMYTPEVSSVPGSVAQVRECARTLMGWAKTHQTPVFMAGHVTKEGDVAGPRVLEHMVDVVLYLEGEGLGVLRLLRSVKNRFGSTHEVAVFQMESGGLVEVPDPSRLLMAQRRGPRIGSVVVPVLEGTRPLLVEIQALTSPTHAPVPRRVVNGLEATRLLMLVAALDRRVGLTLGGQDIIVNVAGGLRVSEPAVDLGVALAVASSFRGVPLEEELVVFGEVGLSGEVRPVPQTERRLQEAARLGLSKAIVALDMNDESPKVSGATVRPVETLAQAIEVALPRGRRRGPQTQETETALVITC